MMSLSIENWLEIKEDEFMKSRYRKHVENLVKNSPVIGFSKESVFKNNEIVSAHELNKLNQYQSLEDEVYPKVKLRNYKKQMYSNFLLFVDNYFLCGGHEFVYLLIPIKYGEYKVIEKEPIGEWARAYWEKEDPNNERDWCYAGEDTGDLFTYILDKFNENFKYTIRGYN